jgi:hypothetical protein
MSMDSTYDPTIPDSEHYLIMLIWFGVAFGSIFLLMAWEVWQDMRRDRRRGSYERHPSQRKDLYHNHNRGTVQK